MQQGVTWTLIHDFLPTSTMDWRVLSMERSWTGYEDDQIDDEFSRFLHRDLSAVAAAVIYGVASFFYPAAKVVGYKPWSSAVTYVAGFLLWFSLAGDTLAHLLLDSRSIGTATWRQWCSAGMMAAILLTSCITFSSIYANCTEANDIFQYFGRPAVVKDAGSVNRYCVDVIITYPVAAFNASIHLMTLRFKWHITILWIAIALFYLGYVVDGGSAITKLGWRQHFAAAVIYIGSGILSSCVSYWREQNRHKQFSVRIQQMIEQQKSDDRANAVTELLCAMLPLPVLTRLLRGEKTVYDFQPCASVMFSDMVAFTAWSAKRPPTAVVAMLNVLVPQFDRWSTMCGVEKVKTIGDAYWAFTGLTTPTNDHADKICRFSRGLLTRLAYANDDHPEWNGIQVRIGVHSGPLPGAILGNRQIAYEPYGPTNSIAELVEKKGLYNQVVCTSRTRDLLRNETCAPHVVDRVCYVDGEVREEYDLYRLFDDQDVVGDDDDDDDDFHEGRSIRSGASSHASTVQSQSSNVATFLRNCAENARRLGHGQSQSLAPLGAVHETSDDISVIQDRYKRRKYDWFMYQFADDIIEGMYQNWARKSHEPLRRMCHVALLVGAVCLMISIFAIEWRVIWTDPSTAWSVACFAAGLSAYACACFLSERDLHYRVDFMLMVIGDLFICTGCAVLKDGDSMFGHNITYLFSNMATLIFFSTVSIPWYGLFLGAVSLGVPLLYVSFNSIYLFCDVLFWVCSLGFDVWLVSFCEKQLRSQFLDEKITEFYTRLQGERETEQKALLETIVPYRVIPPLMRWMATDLNPRHSIVCPYDMACVVFMKLSRPPAAPMTTASRGVRHGGDRLQAPAPHSIVPSPPFSPQATVTMADCEEWSDDGGGDPVDDVRNNPFSPVVVMGGGVAEGPTVRAKGPDDDDAEASPAADFCPPPLTASIGNAITG